MTTIIKQPEVIEHQRIKRNKNNLDKLENPEKITSVWILTDMICNRTLLI